MRTIKRTLKLALVIAATLCMGPSALILDDVVSDMWNWAAK